MTDFLKYDLGFQSAGDVVEVTLTSSAANVRLMDSTNFQRYRQRHDHHYRGGLVTRSPWRHPVPHTGHWFVTVDMRGLRGTTRAKVRVIPRTALRPLPPAATAPMAGDLAEIFHNVAQLDRPADGGATYDVFISHASEDKDAVVRPLARALRELGVSVWYDEFTLRIGDSLRRKIDEGIAHSRFGLVVLSRAFFAKGWPQYELDGLVTMAVDGRQVLLPVWHDVTKTEVVTFSPSLADRVARHTSMSTIEEIAGEMAEVIHNDDDRP